VGVTDHLSHLYPGKENRDKLPSFSWSSHGLNTTERCTCTRKGMSIIIAIKIKQFQEALLALSMRNFLKEHLAWIRSCAPGIISANKKFFLLELDDFWVFDYGNARDVLLVLGFKTFLKTNILSVILFNAIFPEKCLFWYLSCTKLTFSCLF